MFRSEISFHRPEIYGPPKWKTRQAGSGGLLGSLKEILIQRNLYQIESDKIISPKRFQISNVPKYTAAVIVRIKRKIICNNRHVKPFIPEKEDK